MLKRINNLEIAVRVLREKQTNQSPKVWAQLETEVQDLMIKIEDIKCQIKRSSAET